MVYRTIAEIGQAAVLGLIVFLGEGNPRTKRDLGGDDAVPAIEIFFLREHVHRAALAVRVATRPTRQFRHHTTRLHAACKHMTVIAIAGYNRIIRRNSRLHANDNSFLPYIEVAEATNQPHTV